MSKYLILICFVFWSCKTDKKTIDPSPKKVYSKTVGDIAFDETQDDPDFQLCRELDFSPQYYQVIGFEFEGEMSALKKKIRSVYQTPNLKGQTGFLTIRFIINCHGETGRFRLSGINKKLETYTFDNEISDQLLKIVKDLKGWKPVSDISYYQYLTFKIEDGVIIDITP